MPFSLLHPKLQTILHELNITPNPGQNEYLPEIIKGNNVLISASTGTGKTFGAIIGVLDRILKEELKPIAVLVITPLKALNRDIFRRVLPELCSKVNVSISIRHGDTKQSERAKQTKSPSTIMITTPELFQALLPAKILGREYLKKVKIVIVDEIHELVSTKRGVQLSLALERLKWRIGDNYQRIGLSATIGSPKEVAEFLSGFHNDIKIFTIPHVKKTEIDIVGPFYKTYDNQTKLIKHLQTQPEAFSRLIEIISIVKENEGSTLLFTNTRQQAEILGFRLTKYNEYVELKDRVKFHVHHSSLSQEARILAEKEVRESKTDLIIATSSLELGIDVGKISLVIQYMSPRRVEALLQRVGRSGHSVTGVSKGVIFTENNRDILESHIISELGLENTVEENVIHLPSYDILFQNIIGILLDFGETTIDDILSIITGSSLYQDFDFGDIEPLISFGSENYYFWFNEESDLGKPSLRAKKKAYKYYYKNLSTIPDKKTYDVVDVGSRKRVGILDGRFISLHGEKGSKFVLNGTPWQILNVKDKKVEVNQLIAVSDAAIPTWEGELIPVSRLITERALKIISEEKSIEDESLPINITQAIESLRKDQREAGVIIDKTKLTIESRGKVSVMHSFLGSKGNQTLGLLIAGLIEARIGDKVYYRSDAYSIVFTLPRPFSVATIFESVEESFFEPLIRQLILNSDLFSWKVIQVAKRFGEIYTEELNPRLTHFLISKYRNSFIGEEAVNEIFSENLDFESVIQLFMGIKSKDIEINQVAVREFSSLAQSAIKPISSSILKIKPSKEMIDAVEKRILQTWVKLICMNSHCKFERSHRVQGLSDIIQCPECSSRYVAVMYKGSTGIKGVLRRSISPKSKKPLTEKERKDLKVAKKSADLVLSFGKRAAFVMAGRGIGPASAVRILREPVKDNDEFISAIIRQESEFAKNREYWN